MQPELRKYLLSRFPSPSDTRWIERLSIQLEFARAFAESHPEYVQTWQREIEAVEDSCLALEANGIDDQIREREARLASISEEAKKYTVHCVGHGHIDMNWMWSWPETVATTRDTFASVLSFMRQYPEFTYSQSQASVYALIEKYDPAMFKEIRQRVQEGRWEVAAIHWVEGDKNIVHGESLCRHILLTRRYFEEKFGLQPEDVPVDWEPDTFGHANTIPNFLAQGAAKYYYCCRAGGGFEHLRVGKERPPLFFWKGTDGSRVLVMKEITWYNSDVNIGRNIGLPLVQFCRATGLRDWMNVYGVGNHGGGPTREEIELYRSMRDWPCFPNVVFGTVRRYFEKIESDISSEGLAIPEIDHELNYEFTGCYTSQSLIKQANRLGENYCLEAETLAALALGHRIGERREQHSDLLNGAWTHVLFNQFHDILPGSGVRQTREHAMGLFQEVGAATGMIKRRAGEALASDLDTAALLPDTPFGDEERAKLGDGVANAPYVAGSGQRSGLTGHSQGSSGGVRFRPFVIWNPCAWDRQEMVRVDLYDMDLDPNRIVARDEDGVQWPAMLVERGHDWAHDRITALFPANVPALGYRTYLLMEGDVTAKCEEVVSHSEASYENASLNIGFDRFGGSFRKVFHKRSKQSVFGEHEEISRIGSWSRTREHPRGMTAWALGGEAHWGELLLPAEVDLRGFSRNEGTNQRSGGSVSGQITQNLRSPHSNSVVQLTHTIDGWRPSIETVAEIDWREIGAREDGIPGLMVEFNTDSVAPESPWEPDPDRIYVCETPFGTVNRKPLDDHEVPSLRFVHHRSKQVSTTLLQDAKYGFMLGTARLCMRAIRSSFDPDHAPEVNKQAFRYAVHFHDERPSPAELVRLGTAFNHPFIVFPANLQEGRGALSKSFGRTLTPGVVLTALKTAEDGNGLIVRLVEYDGSDSVAEVQFSPEVVGNLTSAEVVDLMERPIGTAGELENGKLRVAVKANSFVSVRLS